MNRERKNELNLRQVTPEEETKRMPPRGARERAPRRTRTPLLAYFVWAVLGVCIFMMLVGIGTLLILVSQDIANSEHSNPVIMTGHEKPVTTVPPVGGEPDAGVDGTDSSNDVVATSTDDVRSEESTAPDTNEQEEEPRLDDTVDVDEPDDEMSDDVTNDVPDTTPPDTPPLIVREPYSAQLDYSFGIAVGETLSDLNRAELEQQLDDIAHLGVGWIRADLSWSSIQWRDKDTYYWDKYDQIVEVAHKRGIRVLPILTYTPRWARPESCRYSDKCAPRDAGEFAVFVRAAAARYAPKGVHTWEIWNEPNMGLFWAPHADPEKYTQVLKAAYSAIKNVDSGSTVISGGLAPVATRGANMTAREFVEGMYVHGAKNYFDALGFHPYTYPVLPTDYNDQNAWSQMEQTKWSLRGIMKYNNDGDKAIWLTEVGAPTGGPGTQADSNDFSRFNVPDHVTEDYQAALLEAVVREADTYPWTGPLFWYSYKDIGTDGSDRENFFGLRRHDGSSKPAYHSLLDLTN